MFKKIGLTFLNPANKINKKNKKEAAEPVSDKKPTGEIICSKDEANAIKAAFIGGQKSTTNIIPDDKNYEYYMFDDEDNVSFEEKEILHELRTIGYVKSLLHQLYFNGYEGEELSIDEIAWKQSQEIIKNSDKNELEDFICNLKEGMERINESASLMPPGMADNELIQEGYNLCGKIIYLLENQEPQ